MPFWKKSIFVLAVLAGHVGVLVGSCTTPRTDGRRLPGGANSPSQAISVTADMFAQKLRRTDGMGAYLPGTSRDGDRSRQGPPVEIDRQYSQPSGVNAAPAKESRASASKVFLTGEDVDVTAVASPDFDEVFQQSLGHLLGSIGIEFWIDETGEIVKVACFEGDCPASVESDLNARFDLRFEPATKNGLPVPSRKLILLGAQPSF